MSRRDGGVGDVRPHDDVLGYLLKHAHLALERRSEAALAEIGVNPRELGVLRVIAGGEARSQQEIAELLDIDRTTMVAFLDGLERRRIVARRPSEHDRRRNVVELTGEGWTVFRTAEGVSVQVEQAFTAYLDETGAADLRQTLRTMLGIGTPDTDDTTNDGAGAPTPQGSGRRRPAGSADAAVADVGAQR